MDRSRMPFSFALSAVVLGLAFAPRIYAQDVPPEMKVLEKRLGNWEGTMSAKPAVFTPDGGKLKGDEKVELVLKGRFIQGKTVNDDQTEATWLATYDVNMKAYRFWFYNSRGHTDESTGQWNEKSKTMTWMRTNPEGITSIAHWRFVDANTLEWDMIAKDKDGKVYLDLTGKMTRKK